MNLRELDAGELDLLVEALTRLFEVKAEAYHQVATLPDFRHLTLADLGVEAIAALRAKLATGRAALRPVAAQLSDGN